MLFFLCQLMQSSSFWHPRYSQFCVLRYSVTNLSTLSGLSLFTSTLYFAKKKNLALSSSHPLTHLTNEPLCSLNETQTCQVTVSRCLPSPLFFCLLVNDAFVFISSVPMNDSNYNRCYWGLKGSVWKPPVLNHPVRSPRMFDQTLPQCNHYKLWLVITTTWQ